MAFIRKKGTHFCLVESYRSGAKVRQRQIAYLGEWPSIKAAISGMNAEIQVIAPQIETLKKEIRMWKGRLPDFFERDSRNREYLRNTGPRIAAIEKKMNGLKFRVSSYRRTLKKLSTLSQFVQSPSYQAPQF